MKVCYAKLYLHTQQKQQLISSWSYSQGIHSDIIEATMYPSFAVNLNLNRYECSRWQCDILTVSHVQIRDKSHQVTCCLIHPIEIQTYTHRQMLLLYVHVAQYDY